MAAHTTRGMDVRPLFHMCAVAYAKQHNWRDWRGKIDDDYGDNGELSETYWDETLGEYEIVKVMDVLKVPGLGVIAWWVLLYLYKDGVWHYPSDIVWAWQLSGVRFIREHFPDYVEM